MNIRLNPLLNTFKSASTLVSTAHAHDGYPTVIVKGFIELITTQFNNFLTSR